MNTSKVQLYFFLILFLSVSAMVFLIFKPFLQVLALAAIFAVLFQPFYKKIVIAFKGREVVAAVSVMVIIAIFVITPLVLLLTQLFNESQDLYISVVSGQGDYLNTVTQAIETPIKKISPNFSLDVASYADQAFSWIVSNIGSFLSGTAKTIFNLLLVAVAFFFFLKDGSKFKNSITRLSPLGADYNHEITEKLEVSIRSVLKGTLFIAMIQGVLAGIGFLIFGIPNATLWGSIAMIAALIPGAGTGLVVLPGIIYLFISGKTVAAVGLLIWGTVMVGMVDNVLMSTLYGRGIKIHPLIILFSVLGGLVFFGPTGFLFGPIAVGLFLTLIKIYSSFILHTGVSKEEEKNIIV